LAQPLNKVAQSLGVGVGSSLRVKHWQDFLVQATSQYAQACLGQIALGYVGCLLCRHGRNATGGCFSLLLSLLLAGLNFRCIKFCCFEVEKEFGEANGSGAVANGAALAA